MAAPRFEACVILAEMRTGSNHLEAMLDAVPGLAGYGEVYNPAFIGREGQDSLLGFDVAHREKAPGALFEALKAGADLPVIRFFHDHDPRMVSALLADRRVAKVILTRNPLDSYLSRKIATATGQWRMTDGRNRKAAKVRFDPDEFAEMCAAWSGFQARLRRALQETGQTAFEIDYSDLARAEVLTGLLRFLGVGGEIDPAASRLKPQNPGGPLQKVENADEMAAAIAKIDPFGLDRPSAADHVRSAVVRPIAVLKDVGLMYLPIAGAYLQPMLDWLGALGGRGVQRGLTQRDLRQWMRGHPGHLKIAVIEHPLARAHHVFCHTILPTGRPKHADTRRLLRKRYGVPIPEAWPEADYDTQAHRAAFGAWLEVAALAIAGQASFATPRGWSGQHATLQSLADFTLPDRIIRAASLPRDLADIAADLGCGTAPVIAAPADDRPFALGDIYDGDLERLARQAYRRDYVFFGFEDWWG
ncbi:MAG: nodulation protein NodH [Pseudomonadota bacterium]